jgi:hypothetical protein
MAILGLAEDLNRLRHGAIVDGRIGQHCDWRIFNIISSARLEWLKREKMHK